MTTALIITICILLLLAYVFDLSSSSTKIPSVILLLLLGWGVKQACALFDITVPNLTPALPILGTVGLILIVLEGSLELELNHSKLNVIGKSALLALLPILTLSVVLALAFQHFGNTSFKVGLANAIPFAIISSAIAIPSAQNLTAQNKEFITYESSLSDIFGVLFFNFITLNEHIDASSVGHFLIELIVIILITAIATMLLAFLIGKIKHHVKFVPIILMIILIYAISKVYHLPGLLFILLFGLFIGNIDELKQLKFIRHLQPDILNKEVHKFKELTAELAFSVRALFFLLFGFLIQTSELLNTSTIVWALPITASIFLIRFILLKLFKLPLQPTLFIAPRGLITILLFLSIPVTQATSLANKSLIIQVIILSAVVMMLGLMTNKKQTAQ